MIRIVGDVHGKVNEYVNLVKDCDYSVQLGDMAFDYSGLAKLDALRHKWFPGNHDNYDVLYDEPHCLGDYRMVNLGRVEFFFIRGAFSIDAKYRIQQEEVFGVRSWWAKEQLNRKEMEDALEAYKAARPDIMITHTCPRQVAKVIGNPGALRAFGFDPDTFTTHTQELLQECFDFYRPKLHIYGHFHQNRIDVIEGTKFVCLGELNCVDITSTGEIVDYI